MGRAVRVAIVATAAGAATAAFAQMGSMQPGRWTFVQKTTAIDMPGGPPGIANTMRGRSTTIDQCVTPKQVAEGPMGAMKRAQDCTVSYHPGIGGRFTSEMTCRKGKSTTTATSAGIMQPTSFSGTTRLVMSGPQPMTMTSTVTGRRVGDCKG